MSLEKVQSCYAILEGTDLLQNTTFVQPTGRLKAFAFKSRLSVLEQWSPTFPAWWTGMGREEEMVLCEWHEVGFCVRVQAPVACVSVPVACVSV